MDKYEELARAFPFPKCIEEDGTTSLVHCVVGIVGLADAFRWYDERLAKETCECDEWKTASRQITDMCINNALHHGAPFTAPAFRLCPYCGRRIVNKEGK